MQNPDYTLLLPSTTPSTDSFVTLALMNLNNFYLFIYLLLGGVGAKSFDPLINNEHFQVRFLS